LKLFRELCICAALIGVAAVCLWAAVLLATLNQRAAAISTTDVRDLVRDTKDAAFNVATAAHSVQEITAGLADQHTGIARTLRNVDVVTAQAGRTANEIRLASVDLRATVQEIRSGTGPLLAAVHDRVDDTKPILMHLDQQVQALGVQGVATLAQGQHAIHILEPFATGTLGATKVAAGQFAKASIAFEQSWPHILGGVDQIVANSDRTTAASAEIAQNFAIATKPLPKWLRVVLAIAPPVAATGASAVGAGAALGAFR